MVNNYDGGNVTTDDRPWSLRLSGEYELPYASSLGGTWQLQAGAPEITTVLVTSQTLALPQGNQAIWVAPVGQTRYPTVASMDLTVRRTWRLSNGRTVVPRLQMFNILNNATIDAWVAQLGPTYHRPSNIQRARLINFDLSVGF